ncbi:hypothetical protein CRG98_018014 [Punica granatum]|uniref:Uncharacterized protein n=1 Tax=Punica granatum TaxID=22663 RepID=A0A2I0JZ41_PUNGR|nr:hypothetical protein CRG98_018014 [Punica granatum]
MELDRPNQALADPSGTREKTSRFGRLGWLLGKCSDTRLVVRKETALPEAPGGILLQGRWLPTPKRPPEVAVVVVWFQSYRVDLYSPVKITKNRARLGTDLTGQFSGRTSPRWLSMEFCYKVGGSRLLRDPRR